MTAQAIPLGLVAEHPLHGELLSACLRDIPHARFVTVARSAPDLVRNLRRHCASGRAIAVIWCNGNDQAALRSVRMIRFEAPAVRTIVVGIETGVPAAIRYLEAGASGYLTRDDGLNALRKAV